jgi:organic hydroperoxide reductase OsmC/OhrA
MTTIGPVDLTLDGGYRFRVEFAGATLTTDATPPLGEGRGPDSEMLLAAAVANCLAASLAFSLRKFRNAEVPIRARAEAQVGPDASGRPRVQRIDVEIRLGVPASTLRLLERALAQYEDHCVVTQSVRAAIPVTVRVVDADGRVLAG